MTWRTQYKDLPDILKRKMNQHHAHVEECKQHSKVREGRREQRGRGQKEWKEKAETNTDRTRRERT